MSTFVRVRRPLLTDARLVLVDLPLVVVALLVVLLLRGELVAHVRRDLFGGGVRSTSMLLSVCGSERSVLAAKC